MNKQTTVYYVILVLFAFSMAASGMGKLTEQDVLVQATVDLGYPVYLLKILGVAYLLGVIAIVQPKFSALKQWGYAGFSIALIGAAGSHVLAGQAFSTAFPSIVLLVILVSLVVLNNKLADS